MPQQELDLELLRQLNAQPAASQRQASGSLRWGWA
jgi:hypothetical protein